MGNYLKDTIAEIAGYGKEVSALKTKSPSPLRKGL